MIYQRTVPIPLVPIPSGSGSGSLIWVKAPQGVVEIKWNLSSVDKREVLLRWIERDGPEVAEPTRRGFGTRFIEQGITYELGGDVTLQFDAAGLQCDMRIPI